MAPEQRRVLYANHTGEVGGAERSLLDLLDGLPAEIEAEVACPPGELFAAVRSRGVPAHPIPGMDASFRLHAVHTTRGLASVARAGWTLKALAGEIGATLIHANSVRAGLAAGFAARLGGPPVVVHLRDRLPEGLPARITIRAIELGANAVIANSHYVARQLHPHGKRLVRVIYSPLDPDRFDPRRVDRAAARHSLGLSDAPVIAVVAQLTPWKGQDDAIHIVALLGKSHPDLRLLLIGSAKFTTPAARFDSVAYERYLKRLARELRLEPRVLFLGEREDVPELLAATDLLLVPSWQEPFGRAAVEAMAMRVPVVATSEGGPREVVRDGVDGWLLPPRRPGRWARAVSELLGQPALRAEMGRNGRDRAIGEFTIQRHVDQVAAVYDELA